MASSPNPNLSSPSSDVSHLLQRLSSLEQSVHRLLSDKKRASSDHQIVFHLESQLHASSSPRLRDPPPSLYPSTLGQKPNPSSVPCVFQMPLHYPRYTRSDYDTMPESKLDRLLQEYGLPIPPSLPAKRELAIGSFLWKCQRS